jgi:hypothetical protein
MTRISTDANVHHKRMADRVKKEVVAQKGIICREVSGSAIMIKRSSVKWLKNRVSPEANIQTWKQPKQKIIPRLACYHKHQAVRQSD